MTRICQLIGRPRVWWRLILLLVLAGWLAQTLTFRGMRNRAQLPKRHFQVGDFGAAGDGVSDDTMAINRAVAAAAKNGGVVDFAQVKYLIRRRPGAGQGPAIRLDPGVSLDGHGCTLLLDDNCSYIGSSPDLTAQALIDQDLVVGDHTVRVDSAAAFIPGDPVSLRLGDNEWDARETKEMFFTTVVRVRNGHLLELADALPRGVVVNQTTAPNRAVLRFRPLDNPVCSGGYIRAFHLAHTARGNPESGIDLRCATGTQISQISATDPGAGVVLLAYCRGVQVSDIACDQSVALGGHPAKGRIINAWNSADCRFENIEGHAFAGPFAFFESYCRNLQCVNWRIVDDWSRKMGSQRPFNRLLMVVQDSEADFVNLQVRGEGEGAVVCDSGGTTARIRLVDPLILLTGRLEALDLAQVAESGLELQGRRYGPLRRFMQEAVLPAARAAETLPGVVPAGLWRRIVVESPGLTTTQRFRINGQMVTLTPESPTAEVTAVGRIGSDYGTNPPTDRRLTADTTDLTLPVRVKMSVEYFPAEEPPAASEVELPPPARQFIQARLIPP